MHISKGFGLWMWVAAVDHRDAILFPSNRNDEAPPHTMPTVRLPVDNFPCSQIYKGFALGEGGHLPHLARERTEEPIGGGGKHKGSESLRNGGKITLILYFSHNNNNFSTRDSSVLLSLEQPSEFPMSSFPRSLYQQKTDGL